MVLKTLILKGFFHEIEKFHKISIKNFEFLKKLYVSNERPLLVNVVGGILVFC
jgi:hypothetical protein